MNRPRDNAAATATTATSRSDIPHSDLVQQQIQHRLRYLIVLLMLGFGVPPLAQSQAPLERMYGVSDTEFFLGAWPATRHPSNRIAELWNLWDALGLSFMIRPADNNPARIDTLAWSAGTNHRMMITDDELNNAGYGRNVQFYLFDSVETPYMACKFMGRSGGTYRSNPDKNDLPHYPQERVYSTADSTVANQVIADRIVFDHRPSQVYRFLPSWLSSDDREDSAHNTWLFLSDYRKNDSLYLVATGHLFFGGTSQATDQLFKLEVFYEVDRGELYYNSSNDTIRATDSLSFLAATRYVTKGDFIPTGTSPNYNLYQEAVFPLDLKVLANGQRGPRFNPKTAQRLNIRVTWLGGEKVALRSIALRDSLGQLMFGRGASHDAYRSSLMDRVRRLIFGASLSPDSLRRSIIGIYSGEEHAKSEYAGYAKFDKMLRDSFNFVNPTNSNLRDSLPAFSAQSHAGGADKDHDVSRPQAVLQETYLQPLPTPNQNEYGAYPGFFNIPYGHLPSIPEQNGGRFHVPLLPLTQQDVEDYEATFQYGFLGFNQPDSSYAESYVQNHIAYKLGNHARASRRTGRRLMIIPSPNINIHFPIDRTVTPARLDTMIGHIPTAAETRLLVSMALAYGAKGIAYWWYGGYQNFINNYDSATQLWYSGEPMGGGFGPSGPLTTDSSEDFSSSFAFTSSDSTPRITVPNLFVGRGTRSRALKKEVQWLQTIGPEMIKLTWRNTYSLHYAAARSGTNDEDYGFGTRPIPSDEIISEIKSYKLNDTVADAPEATYVELGLFDKKTGTTNGQADSKKDTHYVFVVNRRTFEPPDYGTTISQARRDSMVALAENRRIRLKLNLWRQGAKQYEFVQVREIAADTTRLVGDSIARQPLTVVVPADSGVFDIFLRPGAGSLLEITYRQPDETMIAGKLDYNNQRKIIYWDGRYYATYYKLQSVFDPCSPPGPLNPASHLHIMFRRSIPVDSTGSILWEPIEDTVSKNGCDIRYFNMHPSLTLRSGTQGAVTATIVWTAHIKGDTLDTLHREVLTRSVRLDSTQNRTWGMIEHVAYYRRYAAANPTYTPPNTEWGTPVLCRLDSGYMYAWSDLDNGIRARVRWHNPNNIWPITGPFSQIANIHKLPGILPGRFPSLPAFSHIANHDSSCGLLWLQPMRSHASVRVHYQRLIQTRAPWGPVVTSGSDLLHLTGLYNEGPFHYPSIDQTQDMFSRIQDVAVWEELSPGNRNLRIRSLYTDTTNKTWKWGELVYKFAKYDEPLYPSIGSLNNLNSIAYHDSLKAFFGIAMKAGLRMRQATYRYTETLFNNTLRNYTYGGYYGASSASPTRQANRYAVLYEGANNSPSVLRTTRQFFARERPTDYIAQGREVAFALEDSGECGVRIEMFNPWYSNDSTAEPLSLTLRDTTELLTDSLPHVHTLFRTANFQSHDSTQIGLEILGRFIGSDTNGREIRVVVELMDSATNAVVIALDSFALSSTKTLHEISVEPVLDLLSGTYYMRMRFDTVNVSIPYVVGDSRYNVAEMFGEIGEDGTLAKLLRRESATSGTLARVAAQPNPFTGTTELRFSIPKPGYAMIRVFDPIGRPVAEVVSRQWMEVGRYAVEFDGGQLQPGTYLVELMIDQQRVVEKMVVVR